MRGMETAVSGPACTAAPSERRNAARQRAMLVRKVFETCMIKLLSKSSYQILFNLIIKK
jgi:hypothetical protein